jgi:hypothetical protein
MPPIFFKQRGKKKHPFEEKEEEERGGKRLGVINRLCLLAMIQVTTTREKCRPHLRPGLWDWVARLNYGGQKSE